MFNPAPYQAMALVGLVCPIDRELCLFAASRWYEAQFPESVEHLLQIWEDKGKELLEA